mmetsp:Transcript_10572/g.65015  ORF Transcript_10572/g.65015 Transcript_10572/m.65015 type:complete len:130 (+) Transcript_10572:348-737(+)
MPALTNQHVAAVTTAPAIGGKASAWNQTPRAVVGRTSKKCRANVRCRSDRHGTGRREPKEIRASAYGQDNEQGRVNAKQSIAVAAAMAAYLSGMGQNDVAMALDAPPANEAAAVVEDARLNPNEQALCG